MWLGQLIYRRREALLVANLRHPHNRLNKPKEPGEEGVEVGVAEVEAEAEDRG